MIALQEFTIELTREIRLFDGRLQIINMFGSTSISGDQANHKFDFSWRKPGVIWHDSATKILIGLMTTHSLAYASECVRHFGFFAERLNDTPEGTPTSLKLDHFEDYPNRRPISTWPFVQAVLSHWVKQDFAGLDPKIPNFLAQPEKWEERGNGWYFALVANDPRRGALTEQELTSVYNGLNEAYSAQKIDTKQWALCFFLLATGVRPIQITRMRVKDLIKTVGPEGHEITLLISIAKTREANKTTKWRRKSPTQLTEALLEYLNSPDMVSASPDSHLFFNQSVRTSAALQKAFNLLETYSERLREPIPLFPYRFRYTLGTRAIALGARDEEVARLLTHTSLHCVRYYRAALPSLQKPITDAIGSEMTIFARAFKGRLIESLEEATRSGDETALITAYEHLNGEDLGACGTRATCYQDAPRGCLTCTKFEPFREAPWEELRAVLILDRDAESSERIRNITQEQIYAVEYIIAERDAPAGGPAE